MGLCHNHLAELNYKQQEGHRPNDSMMMDNNSNSSLSLETMVHTNIKDGARDNRHVLHESKGKNDTDEDQKNIIAPLMPKAISNYQKNNNNIIKSKSKGTPEKVRSETVEKLRKQISLMMEKMRTDSQVKTKLVQCLKGINDDKYKDVIEVANDNGFEEIITQGKELLGKCWYSNYFIHLC